MWYAVKFSCETWLVLLGAMAALLLRSCTTLHPYSGESTPPMYGDYEAQRHWMEITTNLPINQWYRNTTDNNLQYWGLDYPPLTAYHMWLCGKVASILNENYTKLHDSRGFESEGHRVFMRSTVLIADLIFYIPMIVLYYYTIPKNGYVSDNLRSTKKGKRLLSPSLSSILALLYPGIILIDHGHFQYNCLSLGLAVLATTLLLQDFNIAASVVFCLALNYKQMELYHAMPFFLYLLSRCVPKPGQVLWSGLGKLLKISLAVIVSFAVIWWPFLHSFDDLLAVVVRLFPIDRGVFEDKVANFWCVVNIVYKVKQRFDNYTMMRICLFSTISALLPSGLDLFLRPSRRKFVLALINSSLAFFFFSFHVHEKTILLVAVPVLLYFPYNPFVCFWFLCVSVFSMVPLLLKDGLIVAMVALMVFYVTAFRVSIEHFYRNSLNASDGLAEYYRSLLHVLLDIEYKKKTQMDLLRVTYTQIMKNRKAVETFLFHAIMVASLTGCVLLTLLLLVFEPPERYPDLFVLMISAYAAGHFLVFFIYFNVKQLQIPQEFDFVNIKIKTP